MGNRYIKDNLEKRITLLGIEDTGAFVNRILEKGIEKEEKKRKNFTADIVSAQKGGEKKWKK